MAVTKAKLSYIDGITATTTELNYTDGVTSAIQTQLDAKLASSSYTAADVLTKIKTVDGAGSGLDADLLDGQQGSYYLNTSTSFTGDVSGTYNAIVVADDSHNHTLLSERNNITYGASWLQWTDVYGTSGTGGNGSTPYNPTNDWYHHIIANHANSNGYYIDLAYCFHTNNHYINRMTNGSLTTVKIWNDGNDGAGSGLDADLLDGIDSTGFQRQIDQTTANLASPDATSGTWTTADSDDWGTPRIGTSVARYNDGTGYLQFNVPSGMETAYISQLCWSSGGYADIYGIQADGGAVFLRRINTRQTVENSNEGSNAGNPNQHDGSTVTLAATGLSDFSAIRIQNRSGRIHLTGLGFTSAKLHGAEGVGMVHPQQLSHQGTGSGLDADLLDGYNSATAATANTVAVRDGSGNLSANVFSGTATAARYADLAERYEADAEYTPGTVLIFGGEKEVTQSTTKMDRRKAGIVSTDPAHLMNAEAGDDATHPAVALQGRVPCRVIGEVRKGDLMITSSVPGCAEAWREEGDPRYGSVIGKSLVNKTSTKEELIEVAVGVV